MWVGAVKSEIPGLQLIDLQAPGEVAAKISRASTAGRSNSKIPALQPSEDPDSAVLCVSPEKPAALVAVGCWLLPAVQSLASPSAGRWARLALTAFWSREGSSWEAYWEAVLGVS